MLDQKVSEFFVLINASLYRQFVGLPIGEVRANLVDFLDF